MKGKISSYDKDGKCGFIKTEDGAEYFFQKDIQETEIEVGSEVEFETSEGDKGSEAKDVELAEEN
jgi:cold shock CspA family protein